MTIEYAKKYLLANYFDGDDNVKAVVDGDDETMVMKFIVEILEEIESSKMIELPCKVGDTVYVIGENDIAELEIKDIDFTDTGEYYHAFCKMKKLCNCDYKYGDSCLVEEEICYTSFTNYDLGRTVFLNKEEAEKHGKGN